MTDKNNIDKLFREKLKDFVATPSHSVWNNISTELKNKNKGGKVSIIWWRVAGVAAVLLLLFTFNQLILNEKPNTIEPLQETIVDGVIKKTNLQNTTEDHIDKENKIAEEESNTDKLTTKSSNIPTNKSTVDSKENYNSINKSGNAIVNPENQKNSNNSLTTLKNNLTTSSNPTKNTIANNNTNANLYRDKTKSNRAKIEETDAILDKISKFREKINVAGIYITPADVYLGTSDLIETDVIIKDTKLSLIEAIAENETSEDATEEDYQKWKIASTIAPVYFNALGEGSSIHPQFNNNSKTGEVNLSYGISGSFAINKKFSIRSGINQVNLGYSTNDVIVFANIGTQNDTQLLRNIKMTESAQNLSFISAEEFNFAQVPSVLSNNINSSIDQKLGFIEIPIELEYKISDRKMGVNVIGGFSALFLNENKVFSSFDKKTILLGEATNINKTSFSANFGLGFDFKISDKFIFNLEPVFKYQLNTFNDTSGDFNPFFIGVYSGLKFKF